MSEDEYVAVMKAFNKRYNPLLDQYTEVTILPNELLRLFPMLETELIGMFCIVSTGGKVLETFLSATTDTWAAIMVQGLSLERPMYMTVRFENPVEAMVFKLSV